jgi:hypothetical protein
MFSRAPLFLLWNQKFPGKKPNSRCSEMRVSEG